MAHKIDPDACVACGSCIDECPLGAISAGDVYSIDPDTLVPTELSHRHKFSLNIIKKSDRSFLPDFLFYTASTEVFSCDKR